MHYDKLLRKHRSERLESKRLYNTKHLEVVWRSLTGIAERPTPTVIIHHETPTLEETQRGQDPDGSHHHQAIDSMRFRLLLIFLGGWVYRFLLVPFRWVGFVQGLPFGSAYLSLVRLLRVARVAPVVGQRST